MQELYATIDLGSNSFHMLTAALTNDEIRIQDSISDKVMLAEKLSKSTGIQSEAKQRGIECIQRFSHRLTTIPAENIRIVGTNTLRAAINSDEYVAELENILGKLSIDIISGVEEARLIYLGVNHSWSSITKDTKNLVIDIGGGSTEFIIGKNFKLKLAESLRMGCVAYQRYFPDEIINEKNFQKAVKAAKLELNNIKKDFPKKAWKNAIGSAGTFKAIERILIEAGVVEEGITQSGLEWLKQELLTFDTFSDISICGIKSPRDKTIVPGLAIAWAIFDTLKIEHLHISRGGLREGVLYDLIGRHKAEDIRQRSINSLARRYHVSEKKVKLYHRIARKLIKNIAIDDIALSQEHLRYLEWAAHVCRIGLALNHSQYQQHSAYIIKHSELSGFSIKERRILATLVKCHRRKIPLNSISELKFTEEQTSKFLVLVFILRLTHLIGLNGKMNNCGHLDLSVFDGGFSVALETQWIEKHPLIKKALSQEKKYWDKAELNFEISYRDKR